MLWFKRFCGIIFLLIASFFTAFWSVLYIRPYKGIVGNLCDRTDENPMGYCYEMLPSGGFPFTFLWDDGGVSVVGKLTLLEDKIGFLPFLANWSIYFAIIYFSVLYIRARVNAKADRFIGRSE